MRIRIVAVGRFGGRGKGGDGPEKRLFDHYCARLPFALELREVEEKRPITGPERKRREAELLLAACDGADLLIALDERGKQLSSLAFAEKLGEWRNQGRREICLVIGGADGIDDTIRAKADLLLSLGTMTWPHLLVRGLLAEQIFRAHAILTGHPYHRE